MKGRAGATTTNILVATAASVLLLLFAFQDLSYRSSRYIGEFRLSALRFNQGLRLLVHQSALDAVRGRDPLARQVAGDARSLVFFFERIERSGISIGMARSEDFRRIMVNLESALLALSPVPSDDSLDSPRLAKILAELGPIEETISDLVRSFDNALRLALLVLLGALSVVFVIIAFTILRLIEKYGRSKDKERRANERSREILGAQEEERRRIARDLHDGVAQDIAAARMLCERSVAALRKGDAEGAESATEEAGSLLCKATGAVRGLAISLRPPEFESGGFVDALRRFGEETSRAFGIEVLVVLEGLAPILPGGNDVQVFRVAQEAVRNAARHASASRIDVLILSHPLAFEVFVKDDGIGFDPAAAPVRQSRRIGIPSMRERAEAMGARFSIESGSRGTTVRLVLALA